MVSLDLWFSNGCVKFIFSKLYTFILKKISYIIHICVFINFYTDIERYIVLVCMYVLLA